MSIYLDCNATTPIEPEVVEKINHYLTKDFGNEGSHTHEYGSIAKKAVQEARDNIGNIVEASRNEIIFTSGATESNNIAILGLKDYGIENNKKHIITTAIEHKAVLEPIEELKKIGFEIDILPVDKSGRVNTKDIKDKLRKDTLLVSVMSVNNETGLIQPIKEISELIKDQECYFHVDAAQGFGKDIETLKNKRIDLMSISGHKIYGPKGIGALVTRLRNFNKPPLKPLFFLLLRLFFSPFIIDFIVKLFNQLSYFYLPQIAFKAASHRNFTRFGFASANDKHHINFFHFCIPDLCAYLVSPVIEFSPYTCRLQLV